MELLKNFSLAYCFFFLFLLALMSFSGGLLIPKALSEHATTVSANAIPSADTLNTTKTLSSALK